MKFLYCFLYLIIVSIIVFLIGRIFPRNWINENCFLFKSFKWEKEGKVYEKLKIKKWKTKLPDASILLSRIIPKLYPTKRMKNSEKEKAIILVKESCVAEGTHKVVSILGFFCIYIWKSIGGLSVAVVFYLFNVPFILIQRFNRPRLKKLANKLNNC
jgi:glycosyl-4,4'-diaponeurosporenoate acyltransferase